MEKEDAFGAVSAWASGAGAAAQLHREWHTHSAISPSLGGHIDVRFLNQHLEQFYGALAVQRELPMRS